MEGPVSMSYENFRFLRLFFLPSYNKTNKIETNETVFEPPYIVSFFSLFINKCTTEIEVLTSPTHRRDPTFFLNMSYARKSERDFRLEKLFTDRNKTQKHNDEKTIKESILKVINKIVVMEYLLILWTT